MMKRILLLAVLVLGTLSAAAQTWDGPQWAVVNSSSCFLRLKPDYESGNETQCLMGTVLRVKGEDRYWRLVDAPDYKDVWTTQLNVAFMDEAGKDAWIAAPKYICNVEYTHLFAEPSTVARRVCDFTMGDLVRKGTASRQGWVQVFLPSGRECWARAYDVMDFDEWVRTREATRENLIATAERLLGTPYMWGGASIKHFDCSGFTQFVYRQCGIVLPRNAREQIHTGEEIPYDFDVLRGTVFLFLRGSSYHAFQFEPCLRKQYAKGEVVHSGPVGNLLVGEPVQGAEGEDFPLPLGQGFDGG